MLNNIPDYFKRVGILAVDLKEGFTGPVVSDESIKVKLLYYI